jgi:predicted phosphodiesterase
MQMRLLVLADKPPPGDVLAWVRNNDPDAVICCGDLEVSWIEELRDVGVPKLGVYGNHDSEYMPSLGISNLHLRRMEVAGVAFAGFEGCVRYKPGPHQYTQEEAASLARALPAADVLVCPAHVPRLVVHGHTHPRPAGGVRRVGATRVEHVAGARIVQL